MKKPIANYRLAVAARYSHSARIVISNQFRPVEFYEPVGFLLCMATELSLKAFALDAGFTEKQLSSRNMMGHDLGKAVLMCVKHGLELAEDEIVTLLIMRLGHLAHFYRYGFEEQQRGMGSILLADEQAALASVARLIDRVSGDPSVLRRLHQHPEDLDWPETLPALSPVTYARVVNLMDEVERYANQISSAGKAS
jgi:hypothetical protein